MEIRAEKGMDGEADKKICQVSRVPSASLNERILSSAFQNLAAYPWHDLKLGPGAPAGPNCVSLHLNSSLLEIVMFWSN